MWLWWTILRVTLNAKLPGQEGGGVPADSSLTLHLMWVWVNHSNTNLYLQWRTGSSRPWRMFRWGIWWPQSSLKPRSSPPSSARGRSCSATRSSRFGWPLRLQILRPVTVFHFNFARLPLCMLCSCTLIDRATTLWGDATAIYHRPLAGWRRTYEQTLTVTRCVLTHTHTGCSAKRVDTRACRRP